MTAPAIARTRVASWAAPLLAAAASLLSQPGSALPLQAYFFRDFSVTFYPLRLLQARALATGHVPFWNPYINEGAFVLPALYPLDLLHALWPGPAAVSWLLTLHLPLAALAAYLLSRDLGRSRQAAAFAGALYAGGGLALSSLSLYVFLQALAWTPLVVLAARRTALSAGGRWPSALALLSAVTLSTMAVEFVVQAVLAALALAWMAAPGVRALRRVALALALGGGLAAVPFFVTAGFLGETVRGAGFASDVALGNELHPWSLLQLVVPDLFGPLARPGIGWWGEAFFTRGFPYFVSLYVGAVPLALACCGGRGMARGERVVLLALALLGLWYALGTHGGLAPLLSPLPPFRWFRFPSKALLLPYLSLAAFAAAGYDRLRAGRDWGRVAWVLAALCALSLLPAAAVATRSAWLRARVPLWADGTLSATSVAAAVVAGAAALAAVAARAGRLRPPLAAALLALVAVAELAHAHTGLNPQVSPRFYEPLPEMPGLGLGREGRVFSYGLDASPAFRRFLNTGASGTALWSFFLNRQLLAPYNNVLDGVRTAEDKDLTSFLPSPNLLGPGDREPEQAASILGVLRNAAVTQVMSLDALPGPDLVERARVPSGLPSLELHVYDLSRPLPMASLACRVRAVRDREQATLLPLALGFDPLLDVALEEPALAPTSCRQGAVTTLERSAAREGYEVTTDGDGYLVVRASFARGWSAAVDGRPVPVLRANGRHRAVAVAAGRHEVRLTYSPPGLGLGIAAMALSLVLLAAWAAAPGASAPRPEGAAAAPTPLAVLCPLCGVLLEAASDGRRCPACGALYGERDGILSVTTARVGAPTYDPHYFASLPQVEDRHFWFLARRELIAESIKSALPDWRDRPLFDIGCGTGGLLAYLSSTGIPVAGACDAYPGAVEITRTRLPVPLLLVDEDGPPPLAPGRPALAMFDVLEHIDDDEAALRWMHSVLEPGGALILTVPAHPFLFGPADRMAHHRRRYTRRDLEGKLRAAGFEIRRMTYFMAPLVPLLAVSRGLARLLARERDKDAELRIVPGLNGLLLALLWVERAWLRVSRLPFGSSLLAVATRRAA